MNSPTTGHPMQRVQVKNKLRWKNYEYEIEHDVYVCDETGEQFSTNETDREALIKLCKVHRKFLLDRQSTEVTLWDRCATQEEIEAVDRYLFRLIRSDT